MTIYVCRILCQAIELIGGQEPKTGCVWDTDVDGPLPDKYEFTMSHCQHICPEAKEPFWQAVDPSVTITRRVSPHGKGLSFYIDHRMAEDLGLEAGDYIEGTFKKVPGLKNKEDHA